VPTTIVCPRNDEQPQVIAVTTAVLFAESVVVNAREASGRLLHLRGMQIKGYIRESEESERC
jgi:hypothetical protein